MQRCAAALLALALLTASFVARADECDGLTVAAVDFAGCGQTRCSRPDLRERLIGLTDLLGRPYTAEAAETARQRLARTGYFRTVRLACFAVSPLDAKVTFNVVPNRYVRRVRIVGTRVVFASELEKRLFLNEGAIFNPDQKDSRERLDRQLANLASYLKQEGFDDAVVKAEIRLVEPDLVDVIVRVNEGKVSRIEELAVRLEGPWKDDIPEQYTCPRVSRRDILNVMEVQRGDLFTGRTARTVKRAVREFLQQYGFHSPRVRVEYDTDSEVLRVTVKLQQCYSIHVLQREEDQPHQEGYIRRTDAEIYRALPFRESGIFDRREAQLGIEELLVYYKTRGYLFATVTMQYVDYRSMFPGWPYPLIGGVTYRVTRREPAEIREIHFEGAGAVSRDKLLELMQTRRYDFFDVGGYLQVEQLFADLDLIKKYYHDRGYFRMQYTDARNRDDRVRVQLIRGKDRTTWRYHYLDKAFDVVKPDWENAIRVRIAIDEGEGSRVTAVNLEGVKALPAGELYKVLPLEAGGDFSPSLVHDAVRAIEKRYSALGYNAGVTVRCSAAHPDVPVDECRVGEVRSLKVALSFHIEEGARLEMGRVLVVGNLKTARSVVVRDFPAPGEPFDQTRIDEAVRRLRNLGIFSAVRVQTIGKEEQPPRKRIAVVVQVEETGTRSLELSAGFQKMYDRDEGGRDERMSAGIRDALSTSLHVTNAPLTGSAAMTPINFPDVLLLGEVAYTDRNFLGLAKGLQIPISYGLTTRDPARYAAFTPTWFDLRFLSTDITMRLTPLIIYDRALSRVDKFEYGIEGELSYQVTRHLHTSLTLRTTRTAWKWPWEGDFGPQELELSLTPAARLDFRDNPINPTSGFFLLGKIKYLNAYEIREMRLNDGTSSFKNERESFFQYEVQGQAYLSLRKTVILALNARYGHTFTFGTSQGRLPPTHLFYLGGISGVRGFPARGVLQYNGDGSPRVGRNITTPDAGYEVLEGGATMLNGSVELRFPVVRALGLWGATFLDAGAVAPDLGTRYLHENSFRFSTGFGIRWLIGNQIPLRLDYGFVLDRRCNAVDPLTGECVTQDEAGAFDFGLLYTF